MALSSKLFTEDSPGRPFLQRCSETPAGRFFRGMGTNEGVQDAIARIQAALRQTGLTVSDAGGVYGPSTESAVLKFKGPPNNILGPGQTRPDGIVGIQTIHRLDEAISGNRREPEAREFGSTKWQFKFAGEKGLAGKGTYNMVFTSTEQADTRIFRVNEISANGDMRGGFRGETSGRFTTPVKMNAIDFNLAPCQFSIRKNGRMLGGLWAVSVPSKRFALGLNLPAFADERALGGLESGTLVISGQVLAEA